MMVGHQKDERPSHDKKVGIFRPTRYFPERREGLKIELIIDHAYMKKPLLNPNSMRFREHLVW